MLPILNTRDHLKVLHDAENLTYDNIYEQKKQYRGKLNATQIQKMYEDKNTSTTYKDLMRGTKNQHKRNNTSLTTSQTEAK